MSKRYPWSDAPVSGLARMHRSTAMELAADVREWLPRIVSEGLARRDLLAMGMPAGRAQRLSAYANLHRRGIEIELPGMAATPSPSAPVVADPRPEPEGESVDELLERRSAAFRRKAAKRIMGRVSRVRLHSDEPACLVFFGDMHLDDDGCNLPRLRRDLETVAATEGMHACNLGDITNNWPEGRLARLWAHQTSDLDDEERLIRWVLGAVPWLAIVTGNHDEWARGEQALRLLLELTGNRVIAYGRHEVRLELVWPGGHRCRVVMRHTFKGSSIWNRAHGPLRASKLDPWGHVYVQGHHHESVAHQEPGPDGTWRLVGKARGYKWFDSYAQAHGFDEEHDGGCLCVIVDPHAAPSDRLSYAWDVREAADRLADRRRRRSS